jgi:hypothetical protein
MVELAFFTVRSRCRITVRKVKLWVRRGCVLLQTASYIIIGTTDVGDVENTIVSTLAKCIGAC